MNWQLAMVELTTPTARQFEKVTPDSVGATNLIVPVPLMSPMSKRLTFSVWPAAVDGTRVKKNRVVPPPPWTLA